MKLQSTINRKENNMHKITIVFNSDEPLETLEGLMTDMVNLPDIVQLLPCFDENNEELNEVNINIEEINNGTV